jgi:adenylate cyclase
MTARQAITEGVSIEERPGNPEPRSYPALVTLLQRSRFNPAGLAPQSTSDVGAWLLDAAIGEGDLLLLFQEFAWRLGKAGLPVVRASLHVGTLHPQLFGYAWNWNTDDGLCDEVKVDETVLATDAYRKNPIFKVIDRGEQFRGRTHGPEAEGSPLLRDLRASGITEYVAMPLRAHGAFHNAATLATRQADGFTAPQFDELLKLLRLFALHVERHIAARISENIVTTYLGHEAGAQILGGSIKRGAGTAIDAVLWASDLRGFTALADRLDDRALTAVLNVYFDQLAGSIVEHGGDVLKFIGDGILAVFPFRDYPSQAAAAEAAIRAAEGALSALERLNADPAALPDVAGWRPLRTGIALHRGKVFFGNVGAPERLDFTVIGKAVNATSRVESLCKGTGRTLLVTQAVRDLSARAFEPVGTFDLAGLEQPMPVFGLPQPPTLAAPPE